MTDSRKGRAQTLKEQQIEMLVGDSLSVHIVPSPDHSFLMGSQDVANGYGVSIKTIRSHVTYHKEELKEGIHYIKGAVISSPPAGIQPHAFYWTKAGVVRLGFFVKSDRAIMFRNWAEHLILQKSNLPKVLLPEPPKRKHNRLDSDRLMSIMADVCRVEDHELRISLANKLMNP